ncbi:MAG: arginine N-succinyltransferase [Parachlamydiaceae bacterium]
MYVIRPIKEEDLDNLTHLANQARIGITSLPKNKGKLRRILHQSVESFQQEVITPGFEIYLFLLENSDTKEICGISGIYATTGEHNPIHYYKLKNYPIRQKFPESPELVAILEPIAYATEGSELCSLFLNSKYRKEGLGKLLSLSRFLFIANFPNRFTSHLHALMRSYTDEENENPFWNNVGRHFLDVSFKTLMTRKDEGLDVFPEELAQFKIPTFLLHPEAKTSIGKVHPNTEAALSMLKNQGFIDTEEMDALDGGPKIQAEKKEIKLIKKSFELRVADFKEPRLQTPYFVANLSIDFRCCIAPIEVIKDQAFIGKKVADLLCVNLGDAIRVAPFTH